MLIQNITSIYLTTHFATRNHRYTVDVHECKYWFVLSCETYIPEYKLWNKFQNIYVQEKHLNIKLLGDDNKTYIFICKKHNLFRYFQIIS